VAGQMLMTLSDDDRFSGPEDITENPDAKVCSVTGSTPAINIEEYLASKDQLVLFDVYDKCADALRTGQVDVVTTDNVILAGFVGQSDGEFKLVGDPFTEEPYGIGIEKGDVEFCEFINETLAANEDAYLTAWEETAGQVEGTETPELPEPIECV
jgi:glutamate transport system substrate-binding protein